MKKRGLFFVLVLLLMLTFAFVACNNDPDEHTHTFDTSTWKQDQDYHWHKATCEHIYVEGEKGFHIYENWQTIVEATCDKSGEEETTCSVCGKYVHRYVPNLSHDYDRKKLCKTCGYQYTSPGLIFTRFQNDRSDVELNRIEGETDNIVYLPEFFDGLRVVGIHKHAFQHHSQIEGVVLNKYCYYIDETETFADCTSISTVKVEHMPVVLPTDTQGLLVPSISKKMFANSVVQYNEYKNGRYLGNDGNPYVYLADVIDKSATSFEFHPDMKGILPNALQNCINLTEAVVPNGVDYIGKLAFENCFALNKVVLPNSVYYVADQAFEGCINIQQMHLGENLYNHNFATDSVNQVHVSNLNAFLQKGWDKGKYRLYHNGQEVANITVPDDLHTINLTNCLSVQKISLPSVNQNELDFATSNDLLTTNAYIDVNVEGADNLVQIDVPDSTNKISFTGVPEAICTQYNNGYYLGNSNNNYAYLVHAKSGLTTFDCHPNTKQIGNNVFEEAVLEQITLPQGLIVVGDRAFSYARLKSVSLPTSVTQIGVRAFSFCNMLANVSLNEGLQIIGESAFSGCTQIDSVVIPSTAKEIDLWAFSQCTNLTKVVNNSKVAVDTGLLPNNSAIFREYKNGLYVGNSANPYYTLVSIKEKTVNSIEIHPETRNIAYAAFFASRLTEVVIPDKVEYIGKDAFSGNTNLTKVVFGSGLKFIDSYAFNTCIKLKSVTIPSNVTFIGEGVFARCYDLEQADIQAQISCLPLETFANCGYLKNVKLPSTLQKMETDAFRYCHDLKSVVFGGDASSWTLSYKTHISLDEAITLSASDMSNAETTASLLKKYCFLEWTKK